MNELFEPFVGYGIPPTAQEPELLKTREVKNEVLVSAWSKICTQVGLRWNRYIP